MAERTKNRHSHTNLPGRVESPAIEIYASTGMPKDNVMPTYTHTQTFGHTISFALTTGEKLMDLPPAELYKLPPESWSTYFYEVQEANNTMVDNQYTELQRWELYTRLMEGHSPTPSQYDKKIEKLYMELPTIELKDESGKPALGRLFPNGAHDTTFCGLYLIINGCSEVAIKTLSGIQWLMRKKEALLVQQRAVATEEQTSEMTQKKEITIEEALSTLFIKCLHLNEGKNNIQINKKCINKMRLKVGVMHVLEYRGVLSNHDEAAYAHLIAPILGENPENLRKNINKHQQTIIPYKKNLRELSEEYISKHPSDNPHAMTAKDFTDLWDGIYELIDGFIDTRIELAPLRGKGA